MTFVKTALPNSGFTTHFEVFYDDTLSAAAGLNLATDLLSHVESDLALIQSWFVGVNFQFAFPIAVQIANLDGGAEWMDPPDIALPFGFRPTVTLKPGTGATTGLLRYLLVSEVTEMFMASQRKQWFEPTSIFSGADEGSMGESLSRFLASEFLSITNISMVIFSGFHVVTFWVNTPTRLDAIDFAIDDIQPDEFTGCGTCFLFFLRYQLGFSIQQIIAAAGPNLAAVYTNLTGKTDGWTSFRDLVAMHYPRDGSSYNAPLDNLFPVADLQALSAPSEVSWVVNYEPNQAWVHLTHSLPVRVKVTLTSDDPGLLEVPASIRTTTSTTFPLTVHPQSSSFTDKVVTLTASYAGMSVTTMVKVVRPEHLRVAPLTIVPNVVDDPCVQQFVEGTSLEFIIKNLTVLNDRHSLTYSWAVSGAVTLTSTASTLTIPVLPAAGSQVIINVTVRNGLGIQAQGTYTFRTEQLLTGLLALVRRLDCSVRHLKLEQLHIPPWVPIEEGIVIVEREQVEHVRAQARRVAAAAQAVIAAAKALEAHQSVD